MDTHLVEFVPSILEEIQFQQWTHEERIKCQRFLETLVGTPPQWSIKVERITREILDALLKEEFSDATAHDVLFDLYLLLKFPLQLPTMVAWTSEATITTTTPEMEGLAWKNLKAYFGMLIDTFSVTETYCSTTSRRALANLVHQINTAGWIPTTLLIENLSYDLLGESYVLEPTKSSRVEGRHRAFQLYTVPVFSLANEEIEGYMNLMVVLASITQTRLPSSVFHYRLGLPESKDKDADLMDLTSLEKDALEELHAMARELWKKIDDVIVTHKLMHMRVADIILRCFAARIMTHWPLFLSLFTQIHFPDLGHILGFLLQQYHQHLGKLQKPDSNPTQTFPEDFHQYHFELLIEKSDPCLARADRSVALYQDDLPTFVTILENTTINEKLKVKMTRDFGLVETYIERALGAYSTRNLHLVAALLIKYQITDLASLLPHFDSSLSKYQPQFLDQKVVWEDVTLELTSQNVNKLEKEEGECLQASLLTSLLTIGDLTSAFQLMATYPEVQWCLTFPRVTNQFLRLLSYVLCPFSFASPSNESSSSLLSTSSKASSPTVHTKPYPGKQVYFYPPWTSQLIPNDIPLIHQLLSVVGHLIYLHSPIAMHLCNLVERGQLDEMTLVTGYLVPCLCLLQTPSITLNMQVWHLIGGWNVSKRFSLYHHMKQLYQQPLLQKVEHHVRHVTRYWMKRISKDVVKVYSRKFCKLASGNPVPVLANIVATIMQYENLGSAILEALKYLDAMAMDVLLYTSITSFADQSQYGSIMKKDGSNLETWLLNLSQFLAAWISEFPSVDFAALLSFLDHNAFGIADAHVLSELIAYMTGIQAIHDIPENLIRALECHDCVALRALVPEASKFATACEHLVVVMRSGQLYLRFLAHLKRLYSSLAVKSDWSNFEVIERSDPAELQSALQWRDRVHTYLYQYRWFLRFYFDHIEKTESPRAFDQLSLYHLHYDASLYLTNEATFRDQHQKDYLATQTLWNSQPPPETPDAHSLLLRCIRSPQDSLFVASWLTQSKVDLSKIAASWVQGIWCVGGLTPMETSWFGRVLKLVLLPNVTPYAAQLHSFMMFALHHSDLFLVRNALHLLTVICDVFPQEWQHAQAIQDGLVQHSSDPRLRVLVLVIEGSLNSWFKQQTKLGKRPASQGEDGVSEIEANDGDAKRSKKEEDSQDVEMKPVSSHS
ncbi:THO complex subunit 2 [Coelomomyces lativittatus]|nr:THO complex subunit 2 [Coelomomyces lativittatus]